MIAIILIVLIPILVIAISISIFSFVRAFINRISFYKQINKICKTKNYKITFPRKLLASFFRYSKKPDILIQTPNENYMLRFITCNDNSLFYNFPSPEWHVSFTRILSLPINPTGRFKHLPPFDKEYYSKNDNIENKCIMIFAPCLPKISYLKDSNAKRELAGATIQIDQWTIYKSSEFII